MNRNVDPAKKNEQILSDLLKLESNKYCADCGLKGTRWASWNIGIFLCIRCGGLHRSLGTHISKVKSVTLDKWTDEQVESIKNKGNAKVNVSYNPNSDKHPFPTFSGDMENYIRDKYERKLFMTDDISIATSRMSLSEKSKKNNLMDSEISFEPSNTFKNSSSDSFNNNYSKQLTLLSEMGFTDTEFNYKTLKAANGNLQEALEIIVASNNKQRRKTVEKNIFDDIQEVKLTSSVQNISKEQNKSTPPIQMDDWGFDSTSSSKVEMDCSENALISNHSDFPDIGVLVSDPVRTVQNKQSNSSNPWDDNFVEENPAIEKESKKAAAADDSFDTYKSFKSTADSYFDNPW